jgi:hypothetical protein
MGKRTTLKIKVNDDDLDQKLFARRKRLIERINSLLKNGYKEESIVQMVTIFEIFFKYCFMSFKDRWLSQSPNLSPEDKIEYRKAIRKYLEKMRLYDEYLRNYHIYQNIVPIPEIESLYDTLFGKNERGKLNFQNLSGDRSVRQAYLAFFNFDISKNLDQDQAISEKKWMLLHKLFEERHKIVHEGDETELTSQQINEMLESMDFLVEELQSIFTDTLEVDDLFEMVKKGILSAVEIDVQN